MSTCCFQVGILFSLDFQALIMLLILMWIIRYKAILVSSSFLNHKEEEMNVLAENKEFLSFFPFMIIITLLL